MSAKEIQDLHILLADLRSRTLSKEAGAHAQHENAVRKSRLESEAGKKLAAAALQIHLGTTPDPGELAAEARSEYGKPYFPSYPDFHYNISHSGGLVVCAAADHPLGIDLQEIPADPARALKIASHFFSAEEQESLRDLLPHSDHQKDDKSNSLLCRLFTRFWTARESYIKLTGRGLSEPFEHFRPDLAEGVIYVKEENAPAAYLTENNIEEGFCMTVCTYVPVRSVDLVTCSL